MIAGHGSASSGDSAPYEFDTPGTYTVRGRITDRDGGTTDRTTDVVVNAVTLEMTVGNAVQTSETVTSTSAINPPTLALTRNSHNKTVVNVSGVPTPQSANGRIVYAILDMQGNKVANAGGEWSLLDWNLAGQYTIVGAFDVDGDGEFAPNVDVVLASVVAQPNSDPVVIVYYWHSNWLGGAAGHVSMDVPPTGDWDPSYVSWWPLYRGNPDGPAVWNRTYSADVQDEGFEPVPFVFVGLDADAIHSWWRSFQQCNLNWVLNGPNCVTVVEDALSAGGALNVPAALTPDSLASFLQHYNDGM